MKDSRVFDFRRQTWGHAIHAPKIQEREIVPTFFQWLFGARKAFEPYLTCMGHSTPVPWDGDFILIEMQSGKTARWKIMESRAISDPRDMFHIIRADFDGYLNEEPNR